MIVCLLHPPHANSKDDRLDPPLGLLYIASNLRKNNIDVKISDLSNQSKSNWEIPYADYYGITVYITSIQITKEIISICKQINPNCKIIVGGAHPSTCPNDFLYVDHVVVGYGEVAIVNIINGKETDHIIYGKEPDNYFEFPSYDLIDIDSYSRKIGNNPSLPYLTSRGCCFHCSFCGLESMHKLLGYGVKYTDEKTVINHIKRIKEEFGITSINFQDDIFTLKPKRLIKILEFLKKENITFRCMGRAGIDKKETYKLLAESGCNGISWGIESGSQYILDRMKKLVAVEDNYNVIQWAKEYGITARAFFIIGFPGETKETLEETKKFIIEADPDQAFISSFVPYPGTEVYNKSKDYGIINITDDYEQFFQVSADGTGGITTDTKWLTKEEFRKLELEFRNWFTRWMQNKSSTGLQEYEIDLYNIKKERLYNNEQENIDSNSNNDNGVCEGVC